MSEIKKEKSILRKSIIKMRNEMTEEQKKLERDKIFKNLESLGIFSKKRNVLCFLNYGSELDTSTIIEELLKTGSNVYVPRVNNETNTIDICRFTNDTKLVPERHGIPEPEASVPAENPEIIDIILNPGVAFTKDCKRLGYGGGYYDRLMEQTRDDSIKIGIAFDLQIVETLPVEIHDIRLDYIVTASEIF